MNAGGRLLDLSIPKVMGILNITPDSFFDGGRYNTVDAAVLRAEKLLEEGADMLDIGAYSSRPGAAQVSPSEEQDRLIPVIEACRVNFPEAIISIDTFRADVARASIAAGAHLINDISGGTLDYGMFATIAELQVPYILMHMRGTPDTMQQLTDYTDVVQEINLFFGKQIAALRALGVKDIILDPGFGFAKTLKQNYELLRRLDELHLHGLPILGGISRKSMIYKKLGLGPTDALNGTTVLNTVLLIKGVKLLRVHDVRAAKEAITLLQ
ncbi:dihydropteroate synthase [Parapedobacter deserti]|uniref:Dihydropteroate synthase n=1 Tax=Parapedobacter deserti TaxID=1912957 RepID=A0ABV7JR43_9SPHI